MGYVLQITGEIGVFAAAGVVDQLMRHAEMPGAHRHVNPAHGIHRQNRLGTRLLQGPQVGAVVHLMRRHPMRMAMAGQKQHFTAAKLPDLDIS